MGLIDLSNEITQNLDINYGLIAKEAYANLFFDPQTLMKSCAINAQLQLLEEYTGMEIPEDVMSAYAAKHGFFNISDGTSLENLNKLLSEAGINSEIEQFNGIEGLKEALNDGKDIITGVDSSELYHGIEGSIQGADHAVRIVGYHYGYFSIQDPDPRKGLQYVSEQNLSNAWDDYNFQGVEIEPPDPAEISQIKQNIFDMQGEVSPEDVLQARIEDAFARYDNDVAEYAKMGLGSASDHIDINDLPEDVKTDMQAINVDVGNIVATGGYIALMQFYNKNPEKQKRVTKVALALGAFDALTDFSGDQVALDFEINPLLITSLAYYISQVTSNSKNIKLQKFSTGFNKVLSKGFRVIEYAGYAAIAIEGFDLLFDADLGEFFLELVDAIDFLDIFGDVAGTAADGVDIFEGLATLGLSIAASKLIRFLFKKLNKKDFDDINTLTRKTAPKKTLIKLIEAGAPAPMLVGPYKEMLKEI